MNNVMDRSERLHKLQEQPGDSLIVCRCEEITQGEIRRAIHEGMRTMTEIRRFLRPGMGLCQGKTCGRIVKGILARELQTAPADLEDCTARGTTRPVELQVFGNEVWE